MELYNRLRQRKLRQRTCRQSESRHGWVFYRWWRRRLTQSSPSSRRGQDCHPTKQSLMSVQGYIILGWLDLENSCSPTWDIWLTFNSSHCTDLTGLDEEKLWFSGKTGALLSCEVWPESLSSSSSSSSSPSLSSSLSLSLSSSLSSSS